MNQIPGYQANHSFKLCWCNVKFHNFPNSLSVGKSENIFKQRIARIQKKKIITLFNQSESVISLHSQSESVISEW